MSARWMTLGIWALVAAAAVAWGLKVFVRPAPVPAGTAVADGAPVLQADLTRLLGADALPVTGAPEQVAPAPESSRFTLVGVVAPRGTAAARSREGVALIAVDDRPPRAYRIGSAVDGDTVLQSVSQRGVELGPRGGPARVALQLQPPEPAATGSLPPAAVPAYAPRPPAPVPPFARPGAARPPAAVSPMPQPADRDALPEPSSEPQPVQPRGNPPTLM